MDCGAPEKMVVEDGEGVDGSMTMEDVFDIMREAIEGEPIFLDIAYTADMLPWLMDVDEVNAIVDGDTKDTIRVTRFTEL